MQEQPPALTDEVRQNPRQDLDELGPGQLLMVLAGCLRQQRLASLEPFGLALHQARAFTAIGRSSERGDGPNSGNGGLRPSDLARRLHIAPRSATEVIDALQDKGLVVRTPSPTDRRATEVRLTDAGRELLRRMRHQPGGDDAIFAALSRPELDQLTTLLRKAAAAHPDALARRRER